MTEIGFAIQIGEIFAFIVAETTSSCVTRLKPEFRLCYRILTINPELLDGVSFYLAVDGEVSRNYRTIGAKTRKSNGGLTNPHFLPSIVTYQIFTSNSPLCIDRSRSITGNNVTIMALTIIVNSNCRHSLQLISRNVSAIADILMNRIACKQHAYCSEKQKYLFHTIFLII